MQPAYRLQQLIRALQARVTDSERALLATTLGPAERALFERMPRFDQRHCLDVYHTLLAGGHSDTPLLQAALLHDCGKVDDRGRPIPLILYGGFVILQRFAPAAYCWAARSKWPLLWPFAIHAVHEQRSAELAQAAGSDTAVVAILRDYAAETRTPATVALAWADGQN